MLIGGLEKLTLIDYPGKVAATVFTSGCNFRCPFCHNPRLTTISEFESPAFSEKEVLDYLNTNKDYLEGVCVTGGEPSLQADLKKFLAEIKSLGLLVKLDTNGSNPEVLENLLAERLVDYIAMDVKSPLEEEAYNYFLPGLNFENIARSVDIIKNSGVDYEFRTTVFPLLAEEDILEIAESLAGSRAYYLQRFSDENELMDEGLRGKKYLQREDLENICEKIKDKFDYCGVRNG
ncbi:MAG: anaerobic ribonucleoside-triphosphate reductase activating protein [Patescibacteria group bacterium]|nr:anaerobic ribonucleoside-triphosphate reductase activating protein [Patescibacteria group bacterium]